MLETGQSKEKAKELLKELPQIKGSDTDGLANWNIRASTLLVFAAIGNMNEQSRQERMNGEQTSNNQDR